MKPVLKSATERLVEVKRDLPKIEQQIDAVTATRRAAVLAGAVADRRRCDGLLRDLRDDLQAARDAIDWLPASVMREQQQQSTWPTDLPSARAMLLLVEPEIARRHAVPRVDRSAAFDAQLDTLINQRYRLRKLILSLQPREDAA